MLEKRWRHCFLLYMEIAAFKQPPSLLVAASGICRPDETMASATLTGNVCVNCHYIGCVFDDNHVQSTSQLRMGFRIGCKSGKPTVATRRILTRMPKPRREELCLSVGIGYTP
jgi:hypothetical protein